MSLPGVYTTYDRQYAYLGSRGFGLPGDFNTRLLVTINGNRLNDPVYEGGPFGRQFPLDMDLVERIEFIPGSDVDGAELTIADSAGAARRGTILNMSVAQNRVTFEVNLQAARGAGLNLSSKLLRLATEVQQ